MPAFSKSRSLWRLVHQKRRFVLLVLGLTGVLLFLNFWFAVMLTRQFRTLEQKRAMQTVNFVVGSLQMEGESLLETLSGWSYWSDTKNYMRKRNADYVERNYSDLMLLKTHVDLVLLTTPQGEVALFRRLGASPPSADHVSRLARAIRQSPRLGRFPSASEGNWGVIRFENDYYLAASRLIFDHTLHGPPAGTILFGRKIDPPFLNMLNRQTFSRVSLAPENGRFPTVEDLPLLPHFPLAVHFAPSSPERMLAGQDHGRYTVHVPLETGPEHLSLSVDIPEHVLTEAAQSLRLVKWTSFIVPLLLFALMAYLLRESFLRRKAEIRADQVQAEFKTIAESVPGVVYQYFYRKDRSHGMLYISPRCYELFGLTAEECVRDIEAVLQLMDDRQALMKSVEKAVKEMSDWRFEGGLTTRDGRRRWWRGMSKPAGLDADTVIFNGILVDITREKADEERLRQQLEFEKLVSHLSKLFINLPAQNLDLTIIESLELLARFAEADRACISLLNPDNQTVSNTHEWCAPGISPSTDGNRHLTPRDFPWTSNMLAKGRILVVNDLSEIPPGEESLLRLLHDTAIKSFLCVPLQEGGQVLGFIGFDSVHTPRSWSPQSIALLQIFSEILSLYLQRQKTQARLRQSEKAILETVLKDAELKALKDQVNPHFLFNSLNSLRALIDENPSKARHAVTLLAQLLRASLKTSHQQLIPLSDEMNVVCAFLALEEIRFEDRLRSTIDIDPDCRSVRVPPMLIQTLVENAVKHGIECSRHGGTIAISASVHDGCFMMRISNPGSLHNAQDSPHIGLQNARERIKLLFGPRGSLRLYEKSPSTVIAELKLPIDP